MADASLVVHRLGPSNGEPWVLLHGLGSTALSWAPILRTLRRDCQIIAPELSALGGSLMPGDNLTVSRAAAIVPELIGRLCGDRPVTLVGISLGGWIAVRSALAAPGLVDRLVLIDAGGYADQDWLEVERVMRVRSLADVGRLQAALFAAPPWWVRLAKGAFHARYTSPSVQTILAQTVPEEGFDDRDLARLEQPTAVIWGQHDGVFKVEVGRKMAAALPTSRLYVLPETGHIAHWEAPRAFLAALADFRAAHPALASEP